MFLYAGIFLGIIVYNNPNGELCMTFGQLLVTAFLNYFLFRYAFKNLKAYLILNSKNVSGEDRDTALKRINCRVFESAKRGSKGGDTEKFNNLFFCLLLTGSLFKLLAFSVFVVGTASTFGIIG